MTRPHNPYSEQADLPTQQFPPVSSAIDSSTPELTVTVLYTASIFEGPDTVYRYDLPAASIDEGWGSAQVVDQAARLLEGQWPRVTIHIDANSDTAAMLAEAFQKQGARVTTKAEQQYSLMHNTPYRTAHQGSEKRFSVSRPQGAAETRRVPKFQLFHAAIAVVIVAVCAISWWAMDTTIPDSQVAAPSADASAPLSEETPTSVISDWSESVTAPEFHEPATTVITELAMQVELPVGYAVTETAEDGLVTMMGNDQDFRVLMATDDIDPAANDLASLAEGVAANPRLSARPDETLVGNRPVVSYIENPSDGSTVYWYIWSEHDKRVSVGCHWRFEVNPAREADCETAVQSLVLVG